MTRECEGSSRHVPSPSPNACGARCCGVFANAASSERGSRSTSTATCHFTVHTQQQPLPHTTPLPQSLLIIAHLRRAASAAAMSSPDTHMLCMCMAIMLLPFLPLLLPRWRPTLRPRPLRPPLLSPDAPAAASSDVGVCVW